MMELRISILDQSPVSEGATPADALQATLEHARIADRLGITRYWLAEHHDSPGFAGTAPEVLAGIVLANTHNVRVGSGGVLLPRYQPQKVAEAFGVLARLYPGRVDLGAGRAGGPAHDFPERVGALLGHLGAAGDPDVWLLGSSKTSAALDARNGTAYCHAHFLNPASGIAAMHAFHTADNGRSAVAVRAFVAETAAAAAAQVDSFLLWRSRKDLGMDGPLPSPETTRRHRWTSMEETRAEAHRSAIIFGPPETIRQQLTELADRHGVDELVVNTLTHDPADRIRAYRLLAESIHQVAPEAGARPPSRTSAGR